MKKLILFLGLVAIGYYSKASSDGQLDSTFHTNGKLITSFATYSSFQDVVIDSNHKILVAGTGNAGITYDFYIQRYNTDGSLDLTFGTNGQTIVDFFNDYDQAIGIGLQSDGKIIVGGKA
jgi:uncharacterized delta-60 repeat protein